jgi:tyrosinase
VSTSYDVYIDVPPARVTAKPDTKRQPLLAGHMSTFGVKKSSSRTDPHGGSGITTVLEITSLIEQLHRDRNWDGQHLDVTFVPHRPKAKPRRAATRPLKVGRISVYYG